MSSKREQVILAVKAVVANALPAALVKRNEVKPMTIPPGGTVNVLDGDPGDPEVTLSPCEYIYEHQIGLEIAAVGGPDALTRAETNLDTMLATLGAAIASNRTLGGLCDFVYAEAPTMLPIEGTGAVAARQADVTVRAIYGTPDPLN